MGELQKQLAITAPACGQLAGLRHSTLVAPFMAVPFASCHSSWALQKPCHFTSLRSTARRKRKPLSINKKLEVSQQWTKIGNGSKLTSQRNTSSPHRQSVQWLEREKRLNQMVSVSIAKQKKPEEQSMWTCTRKCFCGSSHKNVSVKQC